MSVMFAVDIDQTIAGANAQQVYLSFYNQDLQLAIPDEVIHQFHFGDSFLSIPQVRAFTLANPEYKAIWNASHHRAIATAEVLEAFTPFPDAVTGIQYLAQLGTVRYYSARPESTQEVTQRWLERYDFPASTEVVCCSSIPAKLRIMAQHQPADEAIALIDDRGHTHVVQQLEALRLQVPEMAQALTQRLTIVAFGLDPQWEQARPPLPCPLVALPAWSQVHEITDLLGLKTNTVV